MQSYGDFYHPQCFFFFFAPTTCDNPMKTATYQGNTVRICRNKVPY